MNDKDQSIVPLSFFNYKLCPSCGSKKVVAINKFGKIIDDLDFYSIVKLECLNCKREYFPRWIEKDGEYHVVAGDEDQKKSFEKDIIEVCNVNRRKLL